MTLTTSTVGWAGAVDAGAACPPTQPVSDEDTMLMNRRSMVHDWPLAFAANWEPIQLAMLEIQLIQDVSPTWICENGHLVMESQVSLVSFN